MEELKMLKKNQNNEILDSEQQTWSVVSRWAPLKMKLSFLTLWCLMLYIWQADVQVRHLKAPALFIDRTFI